MTSAVNANASSVYAPPVKAGDAAAAADPSPATSDAAVSGANAALTPASTPLIAPETLGALVAQQDPSNSANLGAKFSTAAFSEVGVRTDSSGAVTEVAGAMMFEAKAQVRLGNVTISETETIEIGFDAKLNQQSANQPAAADNSSPASPTSDGSASSAPTPASATPQAAASPEDQVAALALKTLEAINKQLQDVRNGKSENAAGQSDAAKSDPSAPASAAAATPAGQAAGQNPPPTSTADASATTAATAA